MGTLTVLVAQCIILKKKNYPTSNFCSFFIQHRILPILLQNNVKLPQMYQKSVLLDIDPFIIL